MNGKELEGALDQADELVRPCNDVAHGLVNLEPIEERAIIRERSTKIEALAEAMNEILAGNLLRIRISRDQLIRRRENWRFMCWPQSRIPRDG
ncbi:MAG: hypothetical protein F4X97_04940 [Boseongicola sp. SB0662_bin_57]|nr:hypothetical protein [Boseongicola sp. SB0662_bin_57]